MKQMIIFILAACILGGCSTLGGHGMGSTAKNWYKTNATYQQTEADLLDCRERSGYSKSIILTERAAYMYDSFIENCMAKKGYEWTEAKKNPRNAR